MEAMSQVPFFSVCKCLLGGNGRKKIQLGLDKLFFFSSLSSNVRTASRVRKEMSKLNKIGTAITALNVFVLLTERRNIINVVKCRVKVKENRCQ